eukprot:92820-Prorocentrum_lima.AAC.1
MTSSLVGSEMCIRDRSFSEQCAHALRNSASGTSTQARFSPVSPHEAGPVSYTHLTLPTICSV